MARVPRMFPDSTIVCLGGGPSLTAEDVAFCRGKARVVAINDAYRLAPWADVLYACDAAWWAFHQGAPEFRGRKFSIESRAASFGVTVLGNAGEHGLSLDPTCLKNGRNGGYQAINLAVLLGAKRILLLGYDMAIRGGRRHWFGEHPPAIRKDSPYSLFLDRFQSLVSPLKALGVDVINCTPGSALKCFPTAALDAALTGCEVVA